MMDTATYDHIARLIMEVVNEAPAPYGPDEMGAVRGWLRYRAETVREAAKRLRKKDEYAAHMMAAEAERFERLLATLQQENEGR